jgi:Icc-related predicted phosphoesterase
MSRRDHVFVSDLHGREDRYRKLEQLIVADKPRVVLMGGDLFPFERHRPSSEFVGKVFRPTFQRIRDALGDYSPCILIILGNDDPRTLEQDLIDGETERLWTYLHRRCTRRNDVEYIGYSCVPPTPFGLKDWERYDVSRYVDPGCVSPERGQRTVEVPGDEVRSRTIHDDLVALAEGHDMDRAVFLFHSPPYRSKLDRAALDGRAVDHVPLDVHVGSVAIARFIIEQQPLLTLHGHIHESPRLTGAWRQRLGRTLAVSAAHDGEELAVIRFALDDLDNAERTLI